MKSFINKLTLALCLLSFFACGKIKDATTKDIPVESITIELNDITVQEKTRGELQKFYAEQTIKLEDIEALTDEAIKYSDLVESVSVGSASIIIYSVDEVGTVVEEFVLDAKEVSKIEIKEYVLKTEVNTKEVQSFAASVLKHLLLYNKVNVVTSGNTDIPSGKNLRVKISLKNVNIRASVLK